MKDARPECAASTGVPEQLRQRRLDVRLREVTPYVEQRLPRHVRRRVRHAIPQIERGRMPALAVAKERIDRGGDVRVVERQDLNAAFAGEFERQGPRVLAESRHDHDGTLH